MCGGNARQAARPVFNPPRAHIVHIIISYIMSLFARPEEGDNQRAALAALPRYPSRNEVLRALYEEERRTLPLVTESQQFVNPRRVNPAPPPPTGPSTATLSIGRFDIAPEAMEAHVRAHLSANPDMYRTAAWGVTPEPPPPSRYPPTLRPARPADDVVHVAQHSASAAASPPQLDGNYQARGAYVSASPPPLLSLFKEEMRGQPPPRPAVVHPHQPRPVHHPLPAAPVHHYPYPPPVPPAYPPHHHIAPPHAFAHPPAFFGHHHIAPQATYFAPRPPHHPFAAAPFARPPTYPVWR
jgi:hypothetical protein